MTKTIDYVTLCGIIYYLDRIWEEEDNDYVDRRKTRNYERAIENRLKKLNADEQMKRDIYETHRVIDFTFKEQCDRLVARGYEITHGKETNK